MAKNGKGKRPTSGCSGGHRSGKDYRRIRVQKGKKHIKTKPTVKP
jgi:hypothetical protein